MSYVQETRLRKQLRMRTICFVRVGATVTVSALGIVAAFLGYGYKALVITQVVLSFFFFLYYTKSSLIASQKGCKINIIVDIQLL